MSFAEGFQVGYGAVNDLVGKARRKALNQGLAAIMQAAPVNGEENQNANPDNGQNPAPADNVLTQIKNGIGSLFGGDDQTDAAADNTATANQPENNPAPETATPQQVVNPPAPQPAAVSPTNQPNPPNPPPEPDPQSQPAQPVQQGVNPALNTIQNPSTQSASPTPPANPNWSLLGVKFDHAPSDTEANAVRMNKAAELLAAHGEPEQAMQLKAQANQLAMQDAQLQKVRDEQSAKQAMATLWPQTNMGQKVQAWKQQMQQYQDYQNQLKIGADPETLGMPPEQPKFPVLTPDEALADHAMKLAVDAQHGNYDPQAWQQVSKAYQDAENEGYLKALGIANSGASLDKVAEAFNASGKLKFNPQDVASDSQQQQPDGSTARVIALKNGEVINTRAALNNLLTAKEQLDLAMKSAHNQADINQSNAAANNSNASATRTMALQGLDKLETSAKVGQLNAQAVNSKASAEQTGLENQYIREHGEKMGAGNKSDKNFLTTKDYANMIKDHITLGKGQMGLDPAKEERDQQVMERAITYAQKHLNRQPSLAEVLAAGRLQDGVRRKFPDGSVREWDGKAMGWRVLE